MLDGLLGGEAPNDLGYGRDQRVWINMRMHEETTAPDLLLFEGMVDRHGVSRHQIFIVNISGNAHDAARGGAYVDEFHDGIGPHDVPIYRVAVREHALREGLADDN